MLARRLLLDFPWADCLRPLRLCLNMQGDVRHWAKNKITELEKFPKVSPTYWAAMTIASCHVKLLMHPAPITAAEALKQKLVPENLPDCPVSADELTSVWGYKNVNNIVVKTLRKGLPWAKGASKDSIFNLMCELAEHRPRVLQTMIFGNYIHATCIAPISLQLKLQSADNLKLFIEKCSAQFCITLITEFLVAGTIHYSQLHTLVKDTHWWKTFCNNAIKISDTCLRPKLLCDSDVTLNYTNIIRAKQPVFEHTGIWPLILKAFDINTRIKKEIITNAGDKYLLAKELGSKTVLGSGLIEDDLISLDIPLAVVQQIILSGTAPPNRAMKHMRQKVELLSPKEFATLKVYIHSRHTFAFESVIHVVQPETQNCERSIFTYCRNCQSCRSKFVTSKGVSKRLHGLEVDFKSEQALCSTCIGKRVQVLDLQSFIFTTRYVNRAIYSLVFCSRCSVLTADIQIFGNQLLCKHCVKQHTKRRIAGACFFCPHSACYQFVAHWQRQITWVSVCSNHKSLIPNRWGVSVEALSILNEIGLRKKPRVIDYGSRKRACDPVLRLPRN